MMEGIISPDREAVVRLQVRGPSGRMEEIDVVMDTGFTGSLTLPAALIRRLGLPRRGRRQATLADGSEVVLDVYRAAVVWDGRPRDVLVLAAEGGPLLGMSLLYGHTVTLQVVDGGRVVIEPLP